MATPDFWPIESYGATGDGRSVALIAPNGSIDWWCAPALDGMPLFDRLIAGPDGTWFSLEPDKPYTSEQKYVENSNVLQTVFNTEDGVVILTDSLNSGLAGRLPWSEMGRRIEVISGSVRMVWRLRFGSRFSDQPVEHLQPGRWRVNGCSVGLLIGDRPITDTGNNSFEGTIEVTSGETVTIGMVVTYQEPLPLPSMKAIDTRMAISTTAWQQWVETLTVDGPYAADVRRSALALKLLWHSPSGAIAAAATTSLPEKIGAPKNYDYRYGWVRDTAYSLKALIRCGASEEVQASIAWLLQAIRRSDGKPEIFYTLAGGQPGPMVEIPVQGYEGSRPVHVGNDADDQLQHGIYGDIFEAISVYVEQGNMIDATTAEQLVALADQVIDIWQQPDSGIWELADEQHYTMSKIGCWLALQKAIELAEAGHIPGHKLDDWKQCRQAIYDYIESTCWNEDRQAYVMYVGTDKLDAALLLATRFGYPNKQRLAQTLHAVTDELSVGPLFYRYSGAQDEEATFTACSFWAVEAEAFVGDKTKARKQLDALLPQVKNQLGLMSEQVDPDSGRLLGNVPQALSHLAFIHAVDSVSGN